MNNMDNNDNVNIVRIELYGQEGDIIEDITTRTYDKYYANIWGGKAVNHLARDNVKFIRVYFDDVFQYEINRNIQANA